MCGIAGIIAPSRDDRENTHVARVLLENIESRGGDSCGVYSGGRIVKKAVSAWKFRMPPIHGGCLLHTRMATHGKVTRRNAHPFREGNTVGVHNGICFNYAALRDKTPECDSVSVIHAIDKYGVAEAYRRMSGQFATATQRGNEVTLARSGNPCYVYRVGDNYVFSSHSDVGAWLPVWGRGDAVPIALEDQQALVFYDGKLVDVIELEPGLSASTKYWQNGTYHLKGKASYSMHSLEEDDAWWADQLTEHEPLGLDLTERECEMCDDPQGIFDEYSDCSLCDSCYRTLVPMVIQQRNKVLWR